MTKVLVTAEVEDLQSWESGFRSHGDLFRRQTCTGSVAISTQEGNKVAVLFDAENLGTFMEILDSEGPEAMANDGVIRETVNLFVLDKEMQL